MLRLALAQLDLTVGALADNRRRVLDACAEAVGAGADLLLAPELAISGYPPEDLLFRPAFLDACRRETEALAAAAPLPVLFGTPWLDGDRVHNTAVLAAGGEIRALYHKRELPNYSVFDEERTFAAGRQDVGFELGGALVAATVCEDIWLPTTTNRLARGGATVVVNISASPYHVGKGETREEMLRTRARDDLCVLAYCNLVGGQDELLFDGRSVVVDPDGTVVARAATFAEELLVCDVDPRRAVAARLDDPRLRRGEPSPRLGPAATLSPSPRPAARRVPRIAVPPASPVAELWAGLQVGLRDYVAKNGFGSVLLGLSGGVDSALVAALAALALGPERVLALSMPTRYNAVETRSDARVVAERLGIGFEEQPIEDLRLAFHAVLPDTSGLAAENLQARIRGMLLMTLSNQHGHLVLTTGNKSETAVGYSTLYGDSAGGFAPIKDVPKTMVFALCRHLNAVDGRDTIPVSIIDRPPSAELRDAQRDDESLPPYAVLDPIIAAYVEGDLSAEEIAGAGLSDLPTAMRIASLIDRAEYKRRQAPPGIKLYPKAFGRDRRVPITNRFAAAPPGPAAGHPERDGDGGGAAPVEDRRPATDDARRALTR
ncbi:MAG: NAD synthetase / Glutamine amidotransferase chain of NAD synthetase [uncultured Thermoleophilia bacterium]|uniref:Glutamine-dependent NAD(+) synthetase n=1 Tax=uncultured Thermoleophilia bacterium TaxID=1497501 RepID=A0A6J4U9H5_9ACTN|nr:MAG: NAD synthetase / Glutamine amidotransferase chain of NAD synthetase [uncultured Thermoleophilia bacterium]